MLHRPQVAEARPWAARSPAEAGGAMRWDRRCVGRRFCGQAGEAGNGVKEEGWSRVLRGAAGADVSPQHPAVPATSLGVLQSPRVPWRNTPFDYKSHSCAQGLLPDALLLCFCDIQLSCRNMCGPVPSVDAASKPP